MDDLSKKVQVGYASRERIALEDRFTVQIGLVSKFGAADGLCIRANFVLRSLIDRGHVVHTLTQSRIAQTLSSKTVHRFNALQLNPHFSIDAPSAVRMIAKIANEYDLQVLHVQMNSGSTEFMLPLFKSKLPPLVVTFHLAYAGGSSLYRTLFEVAWRASLWASKRYDEIVLVDPSQKPYFLRYGIPEERITIIQNGVDIELFCPGQAAKDESITEFIFVGRLSYDKGVDILLNAFRKYHEENPKTRLTLIGDGMLKLQLKDYNKNGSIRWLGPLMHESIPKYLQQADAFVIPQNIGGLGLSVLEAMSCGLPVITTSIGETTRLLHEDEGFLVEPRSVNGVVEAMRIIAENQSLRRSMGEKCRRKVEQKYSWSSQVESLEEVYKRAMSLTRSS